MDKVRDSVLRYGELIENIIVQFESIIKAILKFDLPDQSVAAVEAVAVSLSSLFIAMEMISYFSTMRMEGRIEDALQLIIKLVLAKILLENTDAIMSGIYGEFNRLGFSAIETGLNAVREIMPGSIESIVDANKGMIGEGWILMSVALLIVSIVVTVMMISITMQIVGIIFEIAIHQAVGPIALSTLCNSTMRSTGLSFIKSYAAVCLLRSDFYVSFSRVNAYNPWCYRKEIRGYNKTNVRSVKEGIKNGYDDTECAGRNKVVQGKTVLWTYGAAACMCSGYTDTCAAYRTYWKKLFFPGYSWVDNCYRSRPLCGYRLGKLQRYAHRGYRQKNNSILFRQSEAEIYICFPKCGDTQSAPENRACGNIRCT